MPARVPCIPGVASAVSKAIALALMQQVHAQLGSSKFALLFLVSFDGQISSGQSERLCM